MLWGLHTNPSKFGWGRNVTLQAYFWRIYNNGVIGAYKAYISPAICTNRLIFGKWAFFIVFFLDMPTYPIISQFFVTSSLLLSIALHDTVWLIVPSAQVLLTLYYWGRWFYFTPSTDLLDPRTKAQTGTPPFWWITISKNENKNYLSLLCWYNC